MQQALYLKSRLVGGVFDGLLHQARWLLQAKQRRLHPELWELYLEERRLPYVLKAILKADSNVIDVGCHIGSFLNLTQSIAPKGSHVAFEASPAKAAWLRVHFRSATIIGKAVSDKVGVAQFFEDAEKPGNSRIADQPGAYTVPTCTLDAELDGRPVSLIKLDIEGHELPALRGGAETVRRCRPALIFECAPTAVSPDRRALFEFITDDLSYDVFGFADLLHSRGPMQYDEFRRCGIYPFRALNFVALPRQASPR